MGEMEDILAKGYVEPVPQEGTGALRGKTLYILHHNAVNPITPKNFCIILDCTVEHRGKSRDECLPWVKHGK